MTTTTPIITRNGRLLWRQSNGTRRSTRYAERFPGQTQPTGWELWSETQRDAGGRAYPAGVFPVAGIYRQ
jgi:hypothetical protein